MSRRGWSTRGDVVLLVSAMAIGTALLVACALAAPVFAEGFAVAFLCLSVLLVHRARALRSGSQAQLPRPFEHLRVRRLARRGVRAVEAHLRLVAEQQLPGPDRLDRRRRGHPRPARGARRRWSRRP